MPVQDKVVTVRGAQAAVLQVELRPLPNGSVQMMVIGNSKDSNGNQVQLAAAAITVTGVPVIDNLLARALTELRKANGLE